MLVSTIFTSPSVGVPIAFGSTHYFNAIQNVGRVKSFVDDLYMKRGTVSMRVALVLRSAEVLPLFRDLCIPLECQFPPPPSLQTPLGQQPPTKGSAPKEGTGLERAKTRPSCVSSRCVSPKWDMHLSATRPLGFGSEEASVLVQKAQDHLVFIVFRVKYSCPPQCVGKTKKNHKAISACNQQSTKYNLHCCFGHNTTTMS